MTTTHDDNAIANPYPHIRAPTCASFVDDWQPQGYRIVYGRRWDVAGEVEVWTSVAQLTDGTISRASEKHDPPLVHVDTTKFDGLTTEQARELAWGDPRRRERARRMDAISGTRFAEARVPIVDRPVPARSPGAARFFCKADRASGSTG